jgi:hypothetical protein
MPNNDRAVSSNRKRAEAREPANLSQVQVGAPRAATTQTAPVRHDIHSHHPEYPIERLCVHLLEPFQLNFAQHAQRLFGERDGLHLIASRNGLSIRAETEESINAALEVLKDLYRPQIRVGPPTIRYHDGSTLEEPWMGLLVRCAAEHLEPVKRDLTRRGATVMTYEALSSGGVIQASAPLVWLLGYASALKKLTAGSAQHSIWLSHYAPVEDLPPGGDAA